MQTTIPFAHCCAMDPQYCDCVNKNHGTALVGALTSSGLRGRRTRAIRLVIDYYKRLKERDDIERPLQIDYGADYLKIREMHDHLGNCPELMLEQDKQMWEENTWYRAGGDVLCSVCRKPYYDHDQVLGALYLTRLCNGDIVKL